MRANLSNIFADTPELTRLGSNQQLPPAMRVGTLPELPRHQAAMLLRKLITARNSSQTYKGKKPFQSREGRPVQKTADSRRGCAEVLVPFACHRRAGRASQRVRRRLGSELLRERVQWTRGPELHGRPGGRI